MSFDFPGISGLRSPHPKKITHFIAHSQAGCLAALGGCTPVSSVSPPVSDVTPQVAYSFKPNWKSDYEYRSDIAFCESVANHFQYNLPPFAQCMLELGNAMQFEGGPINYPPNSNLATALPYPSLPQPQSGLPSPPSLPDNRQYGSISLPPQSQSTFADTVPIPERTTPSPPSNRSFLTDSDKAKLLEITKRELASAGLACGLIKAMNRDTSLPKCIATKAVAGIGAKIVVEGMGRAVIYTFICGGGSILQSIASSPQIVEAIVEHVGCSS